MNAIRVDEAGVPWQPCPGCGQEVVPSYNGWRRHAEFCVPIARSQQPDDWAKVVIGWIREAERQMDEAHRAGDGQAYLIASRWRQEMRTALTVIDGCRPLVEALRRSEVPDPV